VLNASRSDSLRRILPGFLDILDASPQFLAIGFAERARFTTASSRGVQAPESALMVCTRMSIGSLSDDSRCSSRHPVSERFDWISSVAVSRIQQRPDRREDIHRTQMLILAWIHTDDPCHPRPASGEKRPYESVEAHLYGYANSHYRASTGRTAVAGKWFLRTERHSRWNSSPYALPGAPTQFARDCARPRLEILDCGKALRAPVGRLFSR
jgi:hypothetical protein